MRVVSLLAIVLGDFKVFSLGNDYIVPFISCRTTTHIVVINKSIAKCVYYSNR